MPNLTMRGWVVLYVLAALAMVGLILWSASTWAGPYPTAEQEAEWAR